MHPNWTDFEKYVFEKLEKLSDEISLINEKNSSMRGQIVLIGSIASVIGVAICEMVIRAWAK